MSCCGKGRQQISGATAMRQAPAHPAPAAHARPMRDVVVYFEYVGNTGVTVRGPNTGKSYRFDGPGATVAVDIRDKAAVAGVPRLRQISGLA